MKSSFRWYGEGDPITLRAYPQITGCGKIATKGGGRNGEKELQIMDNIGCVLGGSKGRDTRTAASRGQDL